jgi:hypothetical protein
MLPSAGRPPTTRRVQPTMKTATDATTDDAHAPTIPPADSAPPPTDISWVALCQRQFSDSDRRLKNLADGENAAFHDGV